MLLSKRRVALSPEIRTNRVYALVDEFGELVLEVGECVLRSGECFRRSSSAIGRLGR